MLTFACVFLFISASGLYAFSIDVGNPVLNVKENEGVDLKCSYTADFGSSPRVEWKFKDTTGSQAFIYFDGKPTAQYADRISVYNGGLRINKVTRADTGDYDCEVYGNSGYAERTIKLTVLGDTNAASIVTGFATGALLAVMLLLFGLFWYVTKKSTTGPEPP